MRFNIDKGLLSLVLGAITLVLFAAKPYILDLIEPAKSVGQIIGENARDVIDALNSAGDKASSNKTRTTRATWSNILTIVAFILMTISLVVSMIVINGKTKRLWGILGIVLSLLGLLIYFFHTTIGIIGFIVIAVLVLVLVIFEGV